MAKPKKKRTKRYHGEDARSSVSRPPVVHHYQAAERGRIGQWWFEKKPLLKPLLWISGGILVFGWLLVELARLVF